MSDRLDEYVDGVFTGVDFTMSDLRGLHLDGAALTGVRFGRAALQGVTFRGATLTRGMEEKDVAIQVRGLQKSYRELQVLKGVDLDVARRSIWFAEDASWENYTNTPGRSSNLRSTEHPMTTQASRSQGIAPGTAFEDLPDDWLCPDCGAPKEDFEPYQE